MASACVRRSAVTALVAAVLLTPAGAAGASPPSAADGAALLKAERWMVRGQRGDGGLPLQGLAARQRVNLWGALGLAAAGVNAQDQASASNGRTLFALLRGLAADGELSATTDLALYLLAVHAVGFTGDRDAADAPDITGALLAAQLPGASPDRGAFRPAPGATAGDPLSTAYAVLALASRKDISLSYADDAATWLRAHQNGDGSWGAVAGGPGDVKTTATVLEALAAAPVPAPAATSAGAAWLGLRQGADGGWSPSGDGTTSDVPATAAVARWLLATGVNPNDANNSGGQSPMSFLRGAQDASGSLGRRPGVAAEEPAQATAAAMLALGGVGLLFGPVARGGDAGGLPGQGPPAGLPRGPLLPTETPATKTGAATPSAPTPTSPPVLRTPARPAPTTASSRAGVTRVKARARRRTPARTIDDNNAVPDAGAGSGANGTLATPGAPDRAGGGGGVSTGAVRAPAATAGAAVPLAGRSGGTRAPTGATTARDVRGTLIGRQAATDGARGSSAAAAGALGAQSGGRTTPWWAIGLALAIAAGALAGVGLDRRRPEVAL